MARTEPIARTGGKGIVMAWELSLKLSQRRKHTFLTSLFGFSLARRLYGNPDRLLAHLLWFPAPSFYRCGDRHVELSLEQSSGHNLVGPVILFCKAPSSVGICSISYRSFAMESSGAHGALTATKARPMLHPHHPVSSFPLPNIGQSTLILTPTWQLPSWFLAFWLFAWGMGEEGKGTLLCSSPS